jgi:dihydrofolate reductase
MRKIITWVATSLDGYMEGPNGEGDLGWLMPYVEESLPDNSEMLANEIDAILLGRITYQGSAATGPSQEGEFADLMNTPPKLGAYDNAQLVDDDVEETLRGSASSSPTSSRTPTGLRA